MKYPLLIILVFTLISVKGQNYIPIDTSDNAQRKAFVEAYKARDESFCKELKLQYKGKGGFELVKSMKEYSEEFISQVNEGLFCFDSSFSTKAKAILEEISSENKEIPANIQILISKDPTLNAYCLPNGTLVLNMGIFYWLNNFDQVAAVISHEIAHLVLKHSIKAQLKLIADNSSSSSRSTLKEVQSQKYNRSEKAYELLKNKLYSHGEERRRNEFESDSLGILLMKNTRFNYTDLIETLRLSGRYDTLKVEAVPEAIYEQVFNLPNQKFKEEWMDIEDMSAYDYSLYKEKFNQDSLSTHPDIELRVKRLEFLFPALTSSDSVPVDSSYLTFRRVAEYEQVPGLFSYEEYGMSIYLCLKRIQEGKDDTYYKEWLGNCFEKIYDARKKYQLNRYLDTIDPKEQSPGYQQFLSFMWNLSLDEIKNIKDFYQHKI